MKYEDKHIDALVKSFAHQADHLARVEARVAALERLVTERDVAKKLDWLHERVDKLSRGPQAFG